MSKSPAPLISAGPLQVVSAAALRVLSVASSRGSTHPMKEMAIVTFELEGKRGMKKNRAEVMIKAEGGSESDGDAELGCELDF